MPDTHEQYTHRSGRTARAGRSGVSILLTTPHKRSYIRSLQQQIRAQFDELIVPSGKEAYLQHLTQVVTKIKDSPVPSNLSPEHQQYLQEALGNISQADLLLKLAEYAGAFRFPKELQGELDQSQARYNDRPRHDRRSFSDNGNGGVVISVDIGRKDRISKQHLLNLCWSAHPKGRAVTGAVVIHNDHTTINCSSASIALLIMKALSSQSVNRRPLNAELLQASH
jgi:ATP-dependent RNA helicase DeaD